MRIAITSLLLAMAAATPAYALDDLTAFPLLQEECAQMGDITFGDHGRWATCRVVKGRWFATIDFTDFYQAQYCLGKDGEQCEQMAQLVGPVGNVHLRGREILRGEGHAARLPRDVRGRLGRDLHQP